MRKPLAIVIVSVALAALSLSVFTNSPRAADDTNAVKKAQWEYTSSRESDMQKMGEEGWEAFAVDSPKVWYKRPKAAKEPAH